MVEVEVVLVPADHARPFVTLPNLLLHRTRNDARLFELDHSLLIGCSVGIEIQAKLEHPASIRAARLCADEAKHTVEDPKPLPNLLLDANRVGRLPR
jgi:hypothetical protein